MASPSKNLLVVFGATGNQGSSIINQVLSTPSLSARYSLRAITRDPSSPAAQALAAKNIPVVAADLDNAASVAQAVEGAHTVFALTTTTYDEHTHETETRQGTALVDATVAAGARYLIWSSMSHPFVLSGGALKHVAHFDVKAEIEAYIRQQPIQAAFIAPGSFMQNYFTTQMPKKSQDEDGTWVLANVLEKTTRVPLVDILDTGKWVGAVLADPEAYNGKFVAAAQGMYSMEEVVATMSRVSGKRVVHVRVEDEVYKGWLPEKVRESLFEMYVLMRDWGYFGKDSERLIEEGSQGVKEELVGLEEFLRRTEFKLE